MSIKDEIIKELKACADNGYSAEEIFGDDFKDVLHVKVKGKLIDLYAFTHDVDLFILWHNEYGNLDYILGEEVGL